MEDIRKEINKLFDDFVKNANDRDNFIINFEKLILIKKILKSKNSDDLKDTLKLFSCIIKFEYRKRSFNKRVNYLKKLIYMS